uniref:CWH43-like N-terminal domain-containing protein n=1 Tax=Caenorhabditis japonica TaxID=281687 RepID=A0A8R1E120_CAEJA
MSAAFMTFGGFCLYMICQCYLTFKVTPHVTKWSVFYYRLAFTILSCFSLLFAIVFGVTAAHIYHQTYPDLPTPRPWSRRFYQPGYEFHQISAISEWTCAIFQIFFMQSFGPEFEEISVQFFLQSKYNSAESGISDSERDELETQHII